MFAFVAGPYTCLSSRGCRKSAGDGCALDGTVGTVMRPTRVDVLIALQRRLIWLSEPDNPGGLVTSMTEITTTTQARVRWSCGFTLGCQAVCRCFGNVRSLLPWRRVTHGSCSPRACLRWYVDDTMGKITNDLAARCAPCECQGKKHPCY